MSCNPDAAMPTPSVERSAVNTDFAIRIENLSKCYHIYDRPRDRLKQFILPPIQRAFGLRSSDYFREFWALRDISFRVRRGETVGIVGLNGSGKSTLLKLICGTLSETSGHITTTGRIAALLELGTGFNPEFTGRENIYLNAAILGLSNHEIDAKYENIANFADIGEFLDRPVKTYSSGMYVRLAFAVIANVDADILAIDEALAVGDAVFTQKCMRFLREFKQRGTLLFVSHSMGAVTSLCDRALWLENGQLQSMSSAREVCEQYLARRYSSTHQVKTRPARAARHAEPGHALTLSEHVLNQGRDARLSLLSKSELKNQIRVIDLAEAERSFGNSGAEVLYAAMEDLSGNKLNWVTGGEPARLVIQAKVLVEANNVIIGFNIKDKLGQILIGQNTYFDTYLTPVRALPNDMVEAEFIFRLPIFPRGSYTVDVAVADGSHPDVIQLQWVHDVVVLESQTSSVLSGLIGLPFDRITLNNKREA